MNTTPYTYYISWSSLDLHYYGVRYAPGCDPADLWTTYFTSSKAVAIIRSLHGEPDIIKVRKMFTTAEAALAWEFKVLTRLGVVSKPNWLNQHTGGRRIITTPEMIAKRRDTMMRRHGTSTLGNNPEYRTPERYAKAKKSEVATKKASGAYTEIAQKIAATRETKGSYNATCPHCGKTGRIPGMYRWHFDACRHQ